MYHLSQVENNPCLICVVQAVCNNSFMDDSACDEFGQFVDDYVKEKKHVDQDGLYN